jgi:DNA polymerase-4
MNDINTANPLIMHIDLNSCFATVEQQARPLLRGRPVAITNRNVEYTCIVACSYEAKAYGLKVGMRVAEARQLAPGLIVVESDPPKYHYVYQKLMAIMKQYSPHVTMKSIDEGIIDFHETRQLFTKAGSSTADLIRIGYDIKKQLQSQVGCWMRCNVGIAPNRFLAKLAAGLNKPDGLDVIDHTNLRKTLGELTLTDLPGIASHYAARLNANAIYTPVQFLDSQQIILRHRVFKSICGRDWHQRLRGYEVDDREFATKSVGRQYVMEERTTDESIILSRLALLCESTGTKLRYRNLSARGIYIYATFTSGDLWYQRRTFGSSFFSNAEIYRRALLLFGTRPKQLTIREIGITCYTLEQNARNQPSLLESVNRQEWLTDAIDTVNNQFGELTITYATALQSKKLAAQKVPFGSTRYFEMLYQNVDAPSLPMS